MILCHADGPTDNPKWRFRCGNGGDDDGSPGVSWTISRLQDYRLEQLQGEKVGNIKINQSISALQETCLNQTPTPRPAL